MSSGPGLFIHYHGKDDTNSQTFHRFVDLSSDESGAGPTGALEIASRQINEYIAENGPLTKVQIEWVPKLFTEEEAASLGLGSTTLFTDADGRTTSTLNP